MKYAKQPNQHLSDSAACTYFTVSASAVSSPHGCGGLALQSVMAYSYTDAYNQAQFQQFMPGYEQQVSSVDGSGRKDGHFEVRHENGSGTMFYDTSQYAAPRGADCIIVCGASGSS